VRRCLRCGATWEDDRWRCHACEFEPSRRSGFAAFAPDLDDTDVGMQNESFHLLPCVENESFWFASRNRLIEWAVRTSFPNARSFFEVGCGTGYVLRWMVDRIPRLRVAGSELHTVGLLTAKSRLPEVELYQMDARDLPFEREYDVVGAFDVLEHIEDDERVLSQMFETARPSGGIVVTVPQHPWLWSPLDEYSQHVRRYTRRDLRAKIERAGFRIHKQTSFVSLLLPLMAFSRVRHRQATTVDPTREYRLGPRANAILGGVQRFELALTRARVPLPVGGSLLVVAERPA
jgi:SAM-dependent methyltransferase